MNWYSFKNRIKYNWKRTLAVFFASIGTAIEIALLIAYLFLSESDVSLLSIISYLIVLAAYMYLLTGNIRGTTLAYRGFLLFVFFTFFDFGEALLFNILGNFAIFASGDLFNILIFVISLAFMGLGFASGLITYIKFQQYGRFGYKTTYETIRNWCLVFTICIIIPFVLNLILDFYTYSGVDLLLVSLEPISIVCISIASYITILRIKE